MKVVAIIAASGKAKRLGGISKQLFPLLGKPVSAYAIQAFEDNPLVSDIVVVCGAERVPDFQSMAKDFGFKKVRAVVAGGQERQDSVYNGMKACPPCDIVAIHNGANPLVTQKEITDCINAAKETGAAVVGTRVKETVKRVGADMLVQETPVRAALWAIQTPQCIKFDIAMKAFEKALAEKFYGTDDAQLVERIGVPVKMVEGSYENIKITTLEDIVFAEDVLRRRMTKTRLTYDDAMRLLKHYLGENPTRYRHDLGVARVAAETAMKLKENLSKGRYLQASLVKRIELLDVEELRIAALLHDIGYAEPLNKAGVHAVDAAVFLREKNEEGVARVVLSHNAAFEEAKLRGTDLSQYGFAPQDLLPASLAAEILTYADMCVGQGGVVMGLDERFADIQSRLKPQNPMLARACELAENRLREVYGRVKTLLQVI